jgi:hypothetical protein
MWFFLAMLDFKRHSQTAAPPRESASKAMSVFPTTRLVFFVHEVKVSERALSYS